MSHSRRRAYPSPNDPPPIARSVIATLHRGQVAWPVATNDSRIVRSSSGSYWASSGFDISIDSTRRSDANHDLAELIPGREAYEGRLAVHQVDHRIELGEQPPSPQLIHDGVQIGSPPHGRPQQHPLVPVHAKIGHT